MDLSLIKFNSEKEFIRNYFDHDEWIYQPCIIPLFNGKSYRPDFKDLKRNVFIEVVGTRQAFHKNKRKYSRLILVWPQLSFELRDKFGKRLVKYHKIINKISADLTFLERNNLIHNHRLEHLMNQRGLTVYKLSSKSGVMETVISQIINGWIKPTNEEKEDIANALNVGISEIFVIDKRDLVKF